MKYTRYNLKKEKSNGIYFITIIAGVVIISILVGTLISNVFIKDKFEEINNSHEGTEIQEGENDKSTDSEGIVIESIDESDTSTSDANKNSGVVESTDNNIFYFLQCGAFQDESNAISLSNELNGFGDCIIIEDENIFKVVLGIYKEEELNQIKVKLEAANVEYARNTISIDIGDNQNEDIVKVLNAHYEILKELENNKVEEIKTDSIKSWIVELSNNEITDPNLLEIIKFTEELPNPIKEEYLKEYKTELYEFLRKFK
ncbi:SPOR domain-containing protein [Clostridium sp. DL1XJH146]